MTKTLETSIKRATRPLGFPEPSVGREMIRVAQEQKQISVMLGQWEMILTFFKHALEVPLCCDPTNDRLREVHRTILTGAMSLGECLLTQVKQTAPEEIEGIGYSVQFVHANVRYLRDTYQQWYGERDAAAVEAAYGEICDALTRAAA